VMATLAAASIAKEPTAEVAAIPVGDTLQSGCMTGVPKEHVEDTPVSVNETEVAPQ